MMLATMPDTQNSAWNGGALKLHRNPLFGEVSNNQPRPVFPANAPIAGNGTAVAISYLTLSVPPYLSCFTGRGGKRNHADRESHALTAAQVANLQAAAHFAKAIGLPLTRMVSINWQDAGIPLADMAKATGRFTDLLTKAIARHGSATAWVWAHEYGFCKRGHVHLLVHVPAKLIARLTGLQLRWLRRITGKPYIATVIESRPVGGRLRLEIGNPELYFVNMEAALGYVCKGAPQTVLDSLHIDRAHKPGGRIIGKRCSTSQNIGAKARKAKD
jgi:hypothetical protein